MVRFAVIAGPFSEDVVDGGEVGVNASFQVGVARKRLTEFEDIRSGSEGSVAFACLKSYASQGDCEVVAEAGYGGGGGAVFLLELLQDWEEFCADGFELGLGVGNQAEAGRKDRFGSVYEVLKLVEKWLEFCVGEVFFGGANVRFDSLARLWRLCEGKSPLQQVDEPLVVVGLLLIGNEAADAGCRNLVQEILWCVLRRAVKEVEEGGSGGGLGQEVSNSVGGCLGTFLGDFSRAVDMRAEAGDRWC